jgi:hypothetical protein
LFCLLMYDSGSVRAQIKESAKRSVALIYPATSN